MEIDLIFKLDVEGKYSIDHYLYYSYNGGDTWQRTWKHDIPFEQLLLRQIRRFYVDRLLIPSLKIEGELCQICRNQGKIGIIKFSRYTTGSEKVAQVWYDGDAEVSGDVTYGCRYRIERCDRCGNEESDYA